MKKLIYISLAILLLIGLTGCGLPQNVKTQENQALAIVKTIQLPQSYFNPYTGHEMTPTQIHVRFDGYDYGSGQARFDFTFSYVDPHPSRFLWFVRYLGYDNKYSLELKTYESQNGTDNNGTYSSYSPLTVIHQYFTISELQNNLTGLTWNEGW